MAEPARQHAADLLVAESESMLAYMEGRCAALRASCDAETGQPIRGAVRTERGSSPRVF